MQAEGRRNDSGPASPSGRGTERRLRVHAHSKTVKEFTDLCLIQEINAHNGEPDLIMGTAACVFSSAACSVYRALQCTRTQGQACQMNMSIAQHSSLMIT